MDYVGIEFLFCIKKKMFYFIVTLYEIIDMYNKLYSL